MHQIIRKVGGALPALFYTQNGYIKVATAAGREAWRSLRAQETPIDEIDALIYGDRNFGKYWEPLCPIPSKWGEVRA